MTDERAESSDGRGGAREPYDVEEVLRVLDELDDRAEPMTARQIADVNGRSRSGTYEKAMALAEEGVLRTKKTGPRGRVFWRPLYSTGLLEGDTRE